ncbi:MAG: outer membrane protein [Rhodomicrobiaceae bacterium]
MKKLKVALLGTVFAFAAATAANAADIYEGGGSYKDDPIYMPPMTWAGFYFGGHLGGGFEDDFCYYPGPNVTNVRKICEDGDTFFLGGVHAGYNWQKHGPWIFGVEADISFGDDIDYLASVRARLGVAYDALLFYATGGVAFIGFEDGFGFSDDDTGWVAGLGAEYKVAQNMSVGLEGLYYDFDDDDFHNDDDFWVVRARLSYHLNEAYAEALK